MSLQVRADGTLTRRGKPYRGLGVNYVDCLWRVLADPSATTYRAGFETLAERKIPLAALWVFDFGAQETEWNITAGNARAGQLDRIAAATRTLR